MVTSSFFVYFSFLAGGHIRTSETSGYTKNACISFFFPFYPFSHEALNGRCHCTYRFAGFSLPFFFSFDIKICTLCMWLFLLLLHYMEASSVCLHFLDTQAYSGRLFLLVTTFIVDYRFRLSRQSPIFHVQVYIPISRIS